MPDARKVRKDPNEMTFWEHMDELARRMKVAVYTVVIMTIVMMILPSNITSLGNPFEFYDPLIGAILRAVRQHILPPNVRLIGIELTGPLQLYFVASLVFGVAASLPIVAYEIYRFIDPALYPHERRTIYPFMGSFITLFIIGILFGYFFVARFLITAMFPFFGVVGAEQVISVVDFYNIVFITTLMTGVIFTTPALFVLLVKFGILSTTIVTKNRRYVYAGLFILAAFLTPDGGPIGDLILYIPMIILLEAGVYFAKRYEKRGDIQRAAWLPQRKECRFCGNEISDEATFCPRCGKSQL